VTRSALPIVTDPDFDIHTSWVVRAAPRELSDVVLDPDALEHWCPRVFLNVDIVDRGAADGLGMTVRAFTKGWLPHSFHFITRINDLEPHQYMRLDVQGDFEGYATFELKPDGERTRIDVRWRVNSHHPYIKYIARLLRPVFVWNHTWAMRAGARAMQREVDRRRAKRNVFDARRPTFPHNVPVLREALRLRSAPAQWRHD